MRDITIYVLNADVDHETNINYLSIEAEDPEVIAELMKLAEQKGTVYSLKGFEYACNSEDINLVNSWIYFKNSNTK
jgi:hypothetical protein